LTNNADSNRTALLVVDMQVGFLNPPGLFEADRVLNVVASLIAHARMTGTPVFFTQFDGPPGHRAAEGSAGWQIHSQLSPNTDDVLIRKRESDSFHRSDLHERLQAYRISRLVIAGCITELCVDTTCRRAITLGYHVLLVGDGHTTVDATPNGLPEPEKRIRMTNHVLASLRSENCLIEVVTASHIVGMARCDVPITNATSME